MFLRTSYQQKHCQLGLKKTDRGWNEKRLTDYQNSTGRKQADKTTQPQTHATLAEKGRITQKNESRAKKAEPRTTWDYSLALKLNRVCPARSQNMLGLLAPLFFLFPSFGQDCLWRAPYTYPTTVFGKQITCFPLFRDPPMGKGFVPKCMILRVTVTPDLDYLDHQIWNFSSDQTG